MSFKKNEEMRVKAFGIDVKDLEAELKSANQIIHIMKENNASNAQLAEQVEYSHLLMLRLRDYQATKPLSDITLETMCETALEATKSYYASEENFENDIITEDAIRVHLKEDAEIETDETLADVSNAAMLSIIDENNLEEGFQPDLEFIVGVKKTEGSVREMLKDCIIQHVRNHCLSESSVAQIKDIVEMNPTVSLSEGNGFGR